MASPLKICLVGCGRVSRSHLAGIREIPEFVETVAVVSRDQEKGKAFQAEYGISKYYCNIEDALKDGQIDAFSLCTPNYLHAEMTIKCAKAGRHVLVEKPMANTSAECIQMQKAADNAGITLMIGQSRRFFDAVFKSREMVRSGKIGELITITAMLFGYLPGPPTEWWKDAKMAGGLIIPIWGSHIIDYILWMFGEAPKRVYCETYSNNPNWEGEDEATILIGFDGHRHATIKMSWNTWLSEAKWDGAGKMLSSSDILYHRYIQGSSGTLFLNDETKLTLNGNIIVDGSQKPGNFALQYKEFAEAVREGRKPIASGNEIIPVIRVQEAALESARTHKEICL